MSWGAHEHTTMIARMRLGLACICAFGLLGAGAARATEGLSVTFTTSVTGVNYSPNNVHVVWVVNSTGAFQKTIGRWAKTRRASLTRWYSTSGNESGTTLGVDGYTAATQGNSGTYTANWDLIPKGGTQPVPDGVYTIKLELTCSNGGNPDNYATFTFNKNGTSLTQHPSDQGGYSNITIAYTGRAPAPADVTLAPASLAFGQVVCGAVKDLGIDVNNPGGSDLIVGSIGLSGADRGAYSLVSPPSTPLTIAAGTHATITVRFAPGARQVFNNASLDLATNVAGKAAVSAALGGQGLAPVMSLTSKALNFPAIHVSGQSTQNFSINNLGDAPLHVDALNPVGFGRRAFSVTAPALPATIAPAGTQSVTVRFAPTSDQLYNHARLAVGGDDPALRMTTVSLSGQGLRAVTGQLPPARPIAGPASAVVTLNATTAAVGQGATLATYDVSNPTKPTLLGQVRLAGPIRSLVASGGTIYAALGAEGVGVVNAANPTYPLATATLPTPGSAYEVALAGPILCVADGLSGLQTFNVGNPAAPAPGAAFATQGPARAVATSGSTAYVLDSSYGVQIVSLASPDSPAKLGFQPVEFGTTIACAGQKLYVTTRLMQIHVIDVSTPSSPDLTVTKMLSGPGYAMAIAGNYAYVANGAAGLETFDLTTTRPTYLGLDAIQGEARDIAVQGTTALVAAGGAGLRVLSVATPGSPVELGADALAASGGTTGAAGLTTAMSDGAGSLQVVNLASPVAAALSGAVSKIGEVRAVAIEGSTAYVAAGPAGLKIVNLADPSAPAVTGTFATQGYANGVAVSGSTVLVTDGAKVYRVDATDPTSPTQAGVWTSNGYACGVAISGGAAYVANGGGGLSIFNLGGGGLAPIGGSGTAGVAYGVAVAGGYACVAIGNAGVQLFDVTTPSAPSPLSSFDTAGMASGVALRWPHAYVANGDAGLLVLDYSNPTAPALEAKSNAPARALSVAAGPSRVVFGDTLGGPLYFLFANAAAGWGRYE